jgi:hypothetical protein
MTPTTLPFERDEDPMPDSHSPDAPPTSPGGRWEVTFLHRTRPGRAPHVGGLARIAADSASEARDAAVQRLAQTAGDAPGWSLGLLRPLVPDLAGTHLYRVTFAAWIEDEAAYRREDVFACAVWATDSEAARRLARQRARSAEAYDGAWRVDRVVRIASGRGSARATAA